MNTPNIRYYAKMLYSTQQGKCTPKYTITEAAGYYPPMQELIGRDGKISFNLLHQDREDSSSTPPMKLQAKNSLNFTGLKDFWVEGKMSGLAYGYPLGKPTYSSKGKPNPFYNYKDDGFLFIIKGDEQNPQNLLPIALELVVIENGKPLISAYCKQLEMGGFDEVLALLRQQAQRV
ncbi:MAG: hypothetical protein K5764_01590 [Prevotella sp.]|nr:hypothetical protein [Prevotella sp.]